MVASVVALFFSVILAPMILDTDLISEGSARSVRRWIGRLPYIAFFAGLFAAIIPDRQDAIMIIAGGKAMNYVQSDSSLNKLPYQTTAIISEYLDKQIEELKKDKK